MGWHGGGALWASGRGEQVVLTRKVAGGRAQQAGGWVGARSNAVLQGEVAKAAPLGSGDKEVLKARERSTLR